MNNASAIPQRHLRELAGRLLVLAIAIISPVVRGQSSWPNYPSNNAIAITPQGQAQLVGLGTNAPFSILHLQAKDSSAYITMSNTLSGKYWYQGFLNDGKFALTYSANLAQFYDRFVIDTNGNVGIGTSTPQYTLAVNGNLGAKDVIVTNTGWPDYVFRSDYRLPSLSELSTFIDEHHHLPNIPSESEVKANGVALGDMQAKLLAKIEELTLYLVRQEKEGRDLRENLAKENRELRDRIEQLERRAPAAAFETIIAK